MDRWLNEIDAALVRRPRPATLFLRNDDGGWDDERLLRLVALTEAARVPLAVAVIPTALTPALAHTLYRCATRGDGRLGLHQHGYAHANHEALGRKCEFGPGRDAARQRADLLAGQRTLRRLLGECVDPIFTPPWNRCTQPTVDLLRELGFAALSRDAGAAPLDARGLVEIPVSIDWMKHRDGAAPDGAALSAALGAALGRTDPVGIMLHHAVMTDADFELLAGLLTVLANHRHIRFIAMRDLLAMPLDRALPC